MQADVAQLVEQLIRNQQVVSSNLTVGSRIRMKAWPLECERSFLLGLLRLSLHVDGDAEGVDRNWPEAGEGGMHGLNLLNKMIAGKRAWGKRGPQYNAGKQRLAPRLLSKLTPPHRRL